MERLIEVAALVADGARDEVQAGVRAKAQAEPLFVNDAVAEPGNQASPLPVGGNADVRIEAETLFAPGKEHDGRRRVEGKRRDKGNAVVGKAHGTGKGGCYEGISAVRTLGQGVQLKQAGE